MKLLGVKQSFKVSCFTSFSLSFSFTETIFSEGKPSSHPHLCPEASGKARPDFPLCSPPFILLLTFAVKHLGEKLTSTALHLPYLPPAPCPWLFWCIFAPYSLWWQKISTICDQLSLSCSIHQMCCQTLANQPGFHRMSFYYRHPYMGVSTGKQVREGHCLAETSWNMQIVQCTWVTFGLVLKGGVDMLMVSG